MDFDFTPLIWAAAIVGLFIGFGIGAGLVYLLKECC